VPSVNSAVAEEDESKEETGCQEESKEETEEERCETGEEEYSKLYHRQWIGCSKWTGG